MGPGGVRGVRDSPDARRGSRQRHPHAACGARGAPAVRCRGGDRPRLLLAEHEPETTASKEQQEEALRFHIDLAVQAGKTLMIHNREGDEDLLRILADSPAPRYVQLHCFSSPLAVAEEALEGGYILSFAGNVTFKRNEELREAARIAPAGQLLIETDAPYMTPEPYRGGKNEPSLIGHTYACVAKARGEEPEELAEHVAATFERVFGLVPQGS